MDRRHFVTSAAAVIGGSALVSGTVAGRPAAYGSGNSNRRRRDSEQLDLEEGDLVAEVADPDADNFEEEFTYWVVDLGIEYDASNYRAPARLGPENHETGGSDVERYWFGVSAPDENGIQHEIDHRGQEVLYIREAETADWYEIRAQFDGRGNLRNVNGIKPESSA